MRQSFQTTTYTHFVAEMNKLAKECRLKNTRYTNPHGLSDRSNHSTAHDQAQLSSFAMKNSLFRKIVSTKQHTCETVIPLRLFKERYPYNAVPELATPEFQTTDQFVAFPSTWCNSNRLLTVAGFQGVKTGITQTAGACLSVFYDNQLSGQQQVRLVTVVLGSRDIEYRWKDTRRLTLWAAECIKLNRRQKYGEWGGESNEAANAPLKR